MRYCPDIQEDEREHAAYHDSVVNGVPVPTNVRPKIVVADGSIQITVVDACGELGERDYVREIARNANIEVRHSFGIGVPGDGPDEFRTHAFVLQEKDRAIGLLLMEQRQHVWRISWREYDERHSPPPRHLEMMWSVVFVWVHPKHRRRGLGRWLLHAALGHLRLADDAFGWYTDFSESGEAFARAICPERFWIAK